MAAIEKEMTRLMEMEPSDIVGGVVLLMATVTPSSPRNRSPPLCLPKVPPSARSSYGPPALFKMISLFRFLLLIFLAVTKRSV